MGYTRVNWEDAPSEKTPIDAEHLNQMDKGIADLDKEKLDETGESSNTYVNFEEESKLKALESGSKLSSLFGIVAKAVSSLISHLADTVGHIKSEERTKWNAKADKAHTHTRSDITDFPSSMPASDVYAWAKASTKPAYTKSEVGLGNVDNTADSAKSVKYATSAGSANAVAWENVSGKPSTMAPSAHNQSASTVTAGTFGGKVQANATAMATLNGAQVRDIVVLSSVTEGGAASEPNGTIVFTKG